LIEKMIKEYPGTRFLEFEDDLLIADKEWFRVFSEEYQKKISLPYRVCVRVECITPEVISMLKKSHCTKVTLGLESGNEKLRQNLLNKKFSNNALIEKCRMVKKAGLQLVTFNIVGFPFEGEKEMRDTYKLNKKIAPYGGNCFFFYPYAGTSLYKVCEKNGLLKSVDEMLEVTSYCIKPAIKMTPRQERQCIYYQRKIHGYLKRHVLRDKAECRIAHLSNGYKKHVLFFCYWFALNLWYKLRIYKIIKLGK